MLLAALGFACLLPVANGFAPASSHARQQRLSYGTKNTKQMLSMGDDLFENFKRLWGGGGGGNEENRDPIFSADDASDDEVAGTTPIASIPVQSIKPGGLRLFLMFYLMGMQNTPDRGTWQANQPSSEDYVVEMYYHDSSAMLSIELMDDEINITRFGSLPSTSYLMQESVILQGILDELDQCAFDENIPVNDRLLVPEPSNAIELARGTLSFG
mmetsp:Transcript_85642/g.247334  ORF Transcript_85642/g.247334 Transcript_85642/m.247334 type:complete len:214 (+) Transcript_85642:131-772(+)|eukprot:CAMPEP_0176101164 /NCGR_PEP_ID=MMETSP0120_2-20121206/50742_1 /TAXON_ID=160619 /ORGANISM="Kryptoperidinium foliaceum, Strain CCMP 1326" /LENGTH=213 /DNA_ID=CAMNT_0017435217 /DNA_START=108 /DNA_END=749 /DNA_ORIENTATION=-